MWKSQLAEEWRQEGELKRRCANLLKLVQARFPGAIPADLVTAIQQATDLEVLSRCFDVALTTASVEDVRAILQHTPNGQAASPKS